MSRPHPPLAPLRVHIKYTVTSVLASLGEGLELAARVAILLPSSGSPIPPNVGLVGTFIEAYLGMATGRLSKAMEVIGENLDAFSNAMSENSDVCELKTPEFSDITGVHAWCTLFLPQLFDSSDIDAKVKLLHVMVHLATEDTIAAFDRHIDRLALGEPTRMPGWLLRPQLARMISHAHPSDHTRS